MPDAKSPPAPKAARIRRLRAAWLLVRDYAVRVTAKINDDAAFFMASGIAFDTFLCILPTILLAVAVAGFALGSSETASNQLLSYLDDALPFDTEDIEKALLGLIKSSSTISLVGAGGLLWTASSLVASLRLVAGKIFDVPETRGFLKGKLFDLGMVVVLSLLFLLSLGITSVVSYVEAFGFERLNLLTGDVGWLEELASIALSLAVTFGMFFIAYKFMPSVSLPNRVAVLSAAWASGLWEAAKHGFNFYITHLSSVQMMYGSFGILFVLLLWIYYSGLIFILGGEIGDAYADRQNLLTTKIPNAKKSS